MGLASKKMPIEWVSVHCQIFALSTPDENEGAQFMDVLDGKRFSIDDWIIDIGGMKPHS